MRNISDIIIKLIHFQFTYLKSTYVIHVTLKKFCIIFYLFVPSKLNSIYINYSIISFSLVLLIYILLKMLSYIIHVKCSRLKKLLSHSNTNQHRKKKTSAQYYFHKHYPKIPFKQYTCFFNLIFRRKEKYIGKEVVVKNLLGKNLLTSSFQIIFSGSKIEKCYLFWHVTSFNNLFYSDIAFTLMNIYSFFFNYFAIRVLTKSDIYYDNNIKEMHSGFTYH